MLSLKVNDLIKTEPLLYLSYGNYISNSWRFLNASYNENIKDNGIKHMKLYRLYKHNNYKITYNIYDGIKK